MSPLVLRHEAPKTAGRRSLQGSQPRMLRERSGSPRSVGGGNDRSHLRHFTTTRPSRTNGGSQEERNSKPAERDHWHWRASEWQSSEASTVVKSRHGCAPGASPRQGWRSSLHQSRHSRGRCGINPSTAWSCAKASLQGPHEEHASDRSPSTSPKYALLPP